MGGRLYKNNNKLKEPESEIWINKNEILYLILVHSKSVIDECKAAGWNFTLLTKLNKLVRLESRYVIAVCL